MMLTSESLMKTQLVTHSALLSEWIRLTRLYLLCVAASHLLIIMTPSFRRDTSLTKTPYFFLDNASGSVDGFHATASIALLLQKLILPYVLSMRFDSSTAFDTTHCRVPVNICSLRHQMKEQFQFICFTSVSPIHPLDAGAGAGAGAYVVPFSVQSMITQTDKSGRAVKLAHSVCECREHAE
jgi:hypothetical protein